ncbi:MAG: phosphoenolpyruvate carboxykinase [Nanoarchaeota archaeon]|nr:phosphoenolpyruvate carboxykinase [Nanoarchaeota archaeon]MCG2718209.1 phosphoenolpyruvate carboxykinase [Nanoarchaeota archaeon]
MVNEFEKTAKEIYEYAKKEGRLRLNLSSQELKELALKEPEVTLTKYGSIMAHSEPTSRAAMFTTNNIDTKFGKEEKELLKQAKKRLGKENLVCIEVIVGDGSEDITARLIIPEKFAHMPYGGLKLFKPVDKPLKNPTHQIIMFFDESFEENKSKTLPNKDITIRNYLTSKGGLIKFVRNSNYLGEWKKGVFTGEDYRAKQKGGALFLHAGCRNDHFKMADGSYKDKSSLFVALSANGKTSLTCRVLAKEDKEKSFLVQDDGGILYKDGSFRGFEAGGVFVKTDSLNPEDQIETYNGCLSPNTFLENVYVDDNGEFDFYNVERTANGRAVVERRDFANASKDINVDKINNIFLITRGNIIPAIAKLTLEQATAFMVLGQSMESSAGDPTQVGKIKNVFFYDPFVAGDKTDHANIFYKLLKANPQINCYLINTGGIGEGDSYHEIGLKDSLNILDGVMRGNVGWVLSKHTGLMVPKKIENVDSVIFHPEKKYDQVDFEAKQKSLDKQRFDIINNYPGLVKKVIEVF